MFHLLFVNTQSSFTVQNPLAQLVKLDHVIFLYLSSEYSDGALLTIMYKNRGLKNTTRKQFIAKFYLVSDKPLCLVYSKLFSLLTVNLNHTLINDINFNFNYYLTNYHPQQ